MQEDSKDGLIHIVLVELEKAQGQAWPPPPSSSGSEFRLPPALPLGDGRQLGVTAELLKAVSRYAELYTLNQPLLLPRYKQNEVFSIAQRGFGKVLSSVNYDKCKNELILCIRNRVDHALEMSLGETRRVADFVLGCQLFEGEEAYPLTIGPVSFQTRGQWLQSGLERGIVSKVTARRITNFWAGKPIARRRSSFDSMNEQSILDTVGTCSVVCVVSTDGLSSRMMKEKSLTAARLAMMASSLVWTHPSNGLSWMGLLYDGRVFRRHYSVFDRERLIASSTEVSQTPLGRLLDDSLIKEVVSYQAIFNQIGEALTKYVQPNLETTRPNLLNALFLSLWWFYQACREPSDQMATTKFAASMDVLSGGKKANGIVKFIGVRTGLGPNYRLMTNGRTTAQVVAQFYNQGRSRLIHGSSIDFTHDWSEIRSTAEAVGRLCIVQACHWLINNRGHDDVTAMSRV